MPKIPSIKSMPKMVAICLNISMDNGARIDMLFFSNRDTIKSTLTLDTTQLSTVSVEPHKLLLFKSSDQTMGTSVTSEVHYVISGDQLRML